MSQQDTRAITKEELREQILNQMRVYAREWAALPNKTEQERCDGLAFSILNIFDGTTAALPAFDIVARPHPDDKRYYQENGENYIEDGTILNDDCMLHDLYYRR